MAQGIFSLENVIVYKDDNLTKSSNCCLIKFGDVTDSFAAQISNYTIICNERVQIINCLNDKNHIFTFGSDVTRVTINGFAFKDDVQPVYQWYIDNRAYNEKDVMVNVIAGDNGGNLINFKGRAVGFNLNFSAENIGVANFSISLLEVK